MKQRTFNPFQKETVVDEERLLPVLKNGEG
jgi:hypothetical protein